VTGDARFLVRRPSTLIPRAEEMAMRISTSTARRLAVMLIVAPLSIMRPNSSQASARRRALKPIFE
jgi:hypothetical protein